MIVFYQKRLALLSVPKTGTTAYEEVLTPFADLVLSGPPELKHAPIYRYDRFIRPIFQRVCDVEMEVMAVMREPVSWLSSWYRYRQRPFLDGQPASTKGVTFDEFVLAYMKGDQPAFAKLGRQANFLSAPPHKTQVSYLFRYEDQTRIKAFLQDRLEITFDVPIRNASPKLDVVLDADVRKRYERKFAEDFEMYHSIG